MPCPNCTPQISGHRSLSQTGRGSWCWWPLWCANQKAWYGKSYGTDYPFPPLIVKLYPSKVGCINLTIWCPSVIPSKWQFDRNVNVCLSLSLPPSLFYNHFVYYLNFIFLLFVCQNTSQTHPYLKSWRSSWLDVRRSSNKTMSSKAYLELLVASICRSRRLLCQNFHMAIHAFL